LFGCRKDKKNWKQLEQTDIEFYLVLKVSSEIVKNESRSNSMRFLALVTQMEKKKDYCTKFNQTILGIYDFLNFSNQNILRIHVRKLLKENSGDRLY
jgi:hypothetical protein